MLTGQTVLSGLFRIAYITRHYGLHSAADLVQSQMRLCVMFKADFSW